MITKERVKFICGVLLMIGGAIFSEIQLGVLSFTLYLIGFILWCSCVIEKD